MSLALAVLCTTLAQGEPASPTPGEPAPVGEPRDCSTCVSEAPRDYQLGALFGVSSRRAELDGTEIDLLLPQIGAWYERQWRGNKQLGAFIGATRVRANRAETEDALAERWLPALGVSASVARHLKLYDVVDPDEEGTFDWSLIGGRLRAGLTFHAPSVLTSELGGELSLFGVLHMQLFWAPTLFATQGALGEGELDMSFDQKRAGYGFRLMLGLSRVFRG